MKLMRKEVIELNNLGRVPSADTIIEKNLEALIAKYEELIASIDRPVSNDEARALVTVLGSDDAFGLVWPLVSLIESAPVWPLPDCLESVDNEWVRMLRERVRNSGLHT